LEGFRSNPLPDWAAKNLAAAAFGVLAAAGTFIFKRVRGR